MKDLKHLGFKTSKIKKPSTPDYGGHSRGLSVSLGSSGGGGMLRVVATPNISWGNQEVSWGGELTAYTGTPYLWVNGISYETNYVVFDINNTQNTSILFLTEGADYLYTDVNPAAVVVDSGDFVTLTT